MQDEDESAAAAQVGQLAVVGDEWLPCQLTTFSVQTCARLTHGIHFTSRRGFQSRLGCSREVPGWRQKTLCAPARVAFAHRARALNSWVRPRVCAAELVRSGRRWSLSSRELRE